jgi:hypothetical protein
VHIFSLLPAKEFPCEGDGYDYPAIQSVAKAAAVGEEYSRPFLPQVSTF